MALVRMTMAEIRANGGGRVDYAALEAMTEADMERHAAEDAVDPHECPPGWYPRPSDVRAYLGLKADELDALLYLPGGTWAAWEGAGEVQDPAGRALCRLLIASPDVLRAYRAWCGGYGEAPGGATAPER